MKNQKKRRFKQKVAEIIQKDFQGIKMPLIFFVKRKDMFMETVNLGLFYVLFVDKDILEMNDKAIVGCLVHELCHMGKWRWFRDDEREIDQMVIDKGSGWELYEFLKYHDSIYEKYNKTDGLTKKEVLRQLNKK